MKSCIHRVNPLSAHCRTKGMGHNSCPLQPTWNWSKAHSLMRINCRIYHSYHFAWVEIAAILSSFKEYYPCVRAAGTAKTLSNANVVEAHCCTLHCRRIDCEQIRSRINQQLIAGCFSHKGLRQLHTNWRRPSWPNRAAIYDPNRWLLIVILLSSAVSPSIYAFHLSTTIFNTSNPLYPPITCVYEPGLTQFLNPISAPQWYEAGFDPVWNSPSERGMYI